MAGETPLFTYETTPNGRMLVVCTVEGCRGAARVASGGMQVAKAEAEAQARDKLARLAR